MALKATIFKADLNIADMDRNVYQDHALTIAQHPSENDLRMMVRIAAFALFAHEDLEFTKGLCVDDEPDIWQKNLSNEIELWIDLGQPDEKRIRKACGRARQVVIVTYQSRSATVWWEQVQNKLNRFENLTVINLPDEALEELAQLAQRTMRLQCTIQDGQMWISDGESSVQIEPMVWKQRSE